MSPPRFQARVQGELAAVGWHEGRCVPLDPIIAAFAEAALQLVPAAESFFREFYGLHFPSYSPWVSFDIDHALRVCRAVDLASVESVLKDRLCPIGSSNAVYAFAGIECPYVLLDDQWSSFVVCRSPEAFLSWLAGVRLGEGEIEERPTGL